MRGRGSGTRSRDQAALRRYAIDFPDALEGYADVPIIGTVKTMGVMMALRCWKSTNSSGTEQAEGGGRSRLWSDLLIHELNSRFGQLHSKMEKLIGGTPVHAPSTESLSLAELVNGVRRPLHLAKDSETDERVLRCSVRPGRASRRAATQGARQIEQLLADEFLRLRSSRITPAISRTTSRIASRHRADDELRPPTWRRQRC